MFIYFWEREAVHRHVSRRGTEWGRGREREGDKGSKIVSVLSAQSPGWGWAQTQEPWDYDLIQNDWASQVPHDQFIFYLFIFSLRTSWSLTHVLFRSTWVDLHIFWYLSVVFLLLISRVIPLWPRNRYCIISTPLSLISCILWPQIWSPNLGIFLVKIPCKLQNNVYLLFQGGGSSKYQSNPVDWWCCSIYLLIFCLVNLSVIDRGVLKPATMIVDFSNSPWSSISFCICILVLYC